MPTTSQISDSAVISNSGQDVRTSLSDQENPHNWGKYKKMVIVMTGLLAVMNSTIASSLPSNAGTSLSTNFPAATTIELVLPVSIFLVGYVVGPMIWGPLSEVQGRKPVLAGSFVLYTVFMLACALAPNFPLLLVFRLLCGANAAAPVVVVGGVYADVFPDPRQRGIAIALLMAVTNIGPCLGPIITGNVSHMSWRWSYWVGLMLAGATIPFMLLLPETFAPVLEQRKRREISKPAPEQDCDSDSQTKELRLDVSTATRPFQMILHESIVMLACLYLSFAYGIFYLYFQAYPIIFQGSESIYKLTPRLAGIAFLPIGLGAISAGGLYLVWDAYLARCIKEGKEWTQDKEMCRLVPACAGGPLFVAALFWLGWTCKPEIHWVVPAISGLLFGAGFVLIFIALGFTKLRYNTI